MMSQSSKEIAVYLEIGKKRIVAGAVDWPGWFRVGRDEASVLQALYEIGPRYGQVLSGPMFNFTPPTGPASLRVVERLEGNASTDFGAPGVVPSSDMRPLDEASLHWMQELLRACWNAFDRTVASARGKELRKGPRGGGRDLDRMVEHVLQSEVSYAGRIGLKLPKDENLNHRRQVILDALAAKAQIESPGEGPRGGKYWMPRYFVRTAAYHLLDHVWEIEDRLLPG
jgi:hypothetical protein